MWCTDKRQNFNLPRTYIRSWHRGLHAHVLCLGECGQHTLVIVISDLNVDVSKPDKKWFIQFMLKEFGLEQAGIPSMVFIDSWPIPLKCMYYVYVQVYVSVCSTT